MSAPVPSLSEEAKSIKLGTYKHYKGDLVEVIGISLHSETLEEFVIYKHISGKRTDEPHYWVRPVKIFLDQLEKDNYKGPRFTYVGSII